MQRRRGEPPQHVDGAGQGPGRRAARRLRLAHDDPAAERNGGPPRGGAGPGAAVVEAAHAGALVQPGGCRSPADRGSDRAIPHPDGTHDTVGLFRGQDPEWGGRTEGTGGHRTELPGTACRPGQCDRHGHGDLRDAEHTDCGHLPDASCGWADRVAAGFGRAPGFLTCRPEPVDPDRSRWGSSG